MPMLLVIGLAIFFGTAGAKIFQRLRIPQVVGYIAIGVLVGRSGLGIIGKELLDSLDPFNFFALGIIGFMIGRELHRDVFKKHGRQFMAILLGQGVGAFILVGLVVGTVAWFVGRDVDVKTAVVLGLLFGAISSATAPAATANVMWEYKTRGILTTTTMAIVALDDGLAVALFSISASIGLQIMDPAAGGFGLAIGHAAYEIVGALVLGGGSGVALNFILRRAREHEGALAFVIGAVALVVGLAMLLGVDTILASMALGAVLVNLAPRRSKRAFDMVQRFASPIYVLFFVIVGAHLDFSKEGVPVWVWFLVAPYFLARAFGKAVGANLGARFTGAAKVVRKYLGLCLLCQGGVAVGLAILASKRFVGKTEDIGVAIIAIVTMSTLIAELLGPSCVKLAVKKAGEVGLNVTEEDLVESYRVGDMVDKSCPIFHAETPLAVVLKTIAETDVMAYPVVSDDGMLAGVVTIQELKMSFGGEGLAQWLVAYDLMQPAPDTVTEDTPLAEAMTRMREQDLDYLPVLATEDDPHLVGMLELRAVTRSISHEILRRHELADA